MAISIILNGRVLNNYDKVYMYIIYTCTRIYVYILSECMSVGPYSLLIVYVHLTVSVQMYVYSEI